MASARNTVDPPFRPAHPRVGPGRRVTGQDICQLYWQYPPSILADGRRRHGTASRREVRTVLAVRRPKKNSTIGCRITAIVPGQVLVFQWRSPKQFKSFADVADPLTRVVVSFLPQGPGTRVQLSGTGSRTWVPGLGAFTFREPLSPNCRNVATTREEGSRWFWSKATRRGFVVQNRGLDQKRR
jgi:uncharacterized protein YndB with AHSA1/START domain